MSDSYPLQNIEVKHGAFRAYLEKKYGNKAFKNNGDIKYSYITKSIKSKNKHVRQMAYLARTYHSVTIGKKRLVI